jgi:hypothetical protein
VINPSTQPAHLDCRLYVSDRIGASFDVTYLTVPEAPGPRAVKIVVTDAAGTPVQTIDELLEQSSPSGVGLRDLDGDGRDEVIIPIAQHVFYGSPNTRFSVWRAVGGGTHFERTEMLGIHRRHAHLRREHPVHGTAYAVRREYTGACARARMRGHLWSPSYFAVSCGGAPLSIMKGYIDGQVRQR